jgi:pyridoxamine 5'-phosphate oxidase
MITSGNEFGSDCAVADYASVDPIDLLRRWLPPPESLPALMALATHGCDGYPRVRHVLLSEADDTALYFHTDSRSAKVAELARSPRAAIALAWPAVGRQVVGHGDVHRASADEEARVFSRRGRYLQLLAWLNDDETAAQSVDERHRRWAQFDMSHPELTMPATWTGFAVELDELTFWRGDPDGPSHRTRFRRARNTWISEELAG